MKGMYAKILFVTILNIGFFVQTYFVNINFLSFEKISYQYPKLTSEADYRFYSGLVSIQDAFLNNQTLPSTLSKSYFEYYQ